MSEKARLTAISVLFVGCIVASVYAILIAGSSELWVLFQSAACVIGWIFGGELARYMDSRA